ncbi:hypothetical protein LTR66_002538 [Elasticomyces elasticus]|nr:hypothetical protein LTR66_002538 [Elasticomyces elasticus]
MYKRRLQSALGPGRACVHDVLRAREAYCVAQRQFHASPSKFADREPSSQGRQQNGTPYNTANQTRSRQSRAAAISRDVQSIARSEPSTATRGSNNPFPRDRSRTIDPQAQGRRPPLQSSSGHTVIRRSGGPRSLGGQMGRNTDSEREGPNNQGLRRVIRAGGSGMNSRRRPGHPSESYGGNSDMVRSSPASDLDDDDEDGEMEYGEDDDDNEDDDDDDDDVDEEENQSTQYEMALLHRFDAETVHPVAFEPDQVTKEEFLNLGQGGATIVGENAEGVILDRLKLLAEKTQDGFRHPPHLAERMMQGRFVSFKDEEEKASVIDAAERYAQSRAEVISEKQRAGGDVEKNEYDFAPVPQDVQNATFDKLVRGIYGDLHAQPHKQSVLNEIQRCTTMNPTYLTGDGSRFLRKVQSLLPVAGAVKGGQRPAPKQ